MRPELLARYADERLPRYTSYPTSPRFGPQVGEAAYRAWLAGLAPDLTGSLYLHVPFCRAMCWYCGCHTTVARRDGPVREYLGALRREIELVAQALGRRPSVGHVHFGGGTPTILDPEAFEALAALLKARFDIGPGAEIAVEIDPRTLSDGMVAALARAGTTRASLGVQSFDPAVQAAINRVQSFGQTAAAVDKLRRAGIAAVNFDLVYGLPRQTVASCLDTVERAVALRPDRLSVFGYAHVPSFKKHQQKIRDAELPDGPARLAQADAIAAALQDAGYRRIGLDHYALPHDAMALAHEHGRLRRNFQGYTTDAADFLLGFGASAIGRLPDGYVQNEVVIGRWAEAVEAGRLPVAKGYALSEDDRLRADLIERVMCDFRVDLGRVFGAHRRVPDLAAFPGLARLEADGVIRRDGTAIEVADDARDLVRAVAAAFDAYLGTSGRSHSRTV